MTRSRNTRIRPIPTPARPETWPSRRAAGGSAIDRGFLLGGQALAEAYGKNSESGYYSDWYEGRRDAGNRRIYVGSMMGGKKKLRFKLSDGSLTDHGVIAVDSFAPRPNSTAGRTLVGVLDG